MNTTRTEIPAEVSAFYNRTLLEKAVPLFVHLNWAQVRDIPANSGTDTIAFRRYGLLVAQTTPLEEGVTPAGKKLSTTNLSAQVAYYGDFVTITDKVQIETIDPILVEAADVLGEQSGDSLDQIARNVMVATTTVQYASTATQRSEITSVMKLTRTEVKEMVRTLKNNLAKPISSMIDASTGFNTSPVRRSFVGIVHVNTVSDLEDQTGWLPVENYANKSDLMPGEVGTLSGVRFCETTQAKVYADAGNGGIDVYATLIFGANAYAISRIAGHTLENIVKPIGSSGALDPLNQRGTSGWKATFVCKILNAAWIGVIEHAIS